MVKKMHTGRSNYSVFILEAGDLSGDSHFISSMIFLFMWKRQHLKTV